MMINGPWKIGPPIPEEQEEEVETSTPERTDTDWTAHVTHADPQRWDKHDLTKPVLLVSAGLLNFEDSSCSNGESHDFIEWYRHQFGGHQPYSGFLTNHRQGAGIAKNSFRTCFPELCAGRQVIFLDCALVAADPGDDRSLRGHTGRHWRNVGNFVNHPSFIGLHDDLKEAEGDKPFLVVDFCNQGRHRSVANKEMLHDLFKRNWFGSKRGQVGMIDLQVRHWHKLCAPDCPDCDCKSQEFKDAVERGISRISDFLPTRKKANPCWPDGVHPHARVEVKEEVKDEELPKGPRRGEKKIRLLEDPKPKVKVDKREIQEVRAKQLHEQLTRRKELFPGEATVRRQSGEEDSKRRAKLEEHVPKVKSRGDAYAQEHSNFNPKAPSGDAYTMRAGHDARDDSP